MHSCEHKFKIEYYVPIIESANLLVICTLHFAFFCKFSAKILKYKNIVYNNIIRKINQWKIECEGRQWYQILDSKWSRLMQFLYYEWVMTYVQVAGSIPIPSIPTTHWKLYRSGLSFNGIAR